MKHAVCTGHVRAHTLFIGNVAAVNFNAERHQMAAGDSAYLDGGVPHTWENLGSGTARTLWVITGKEE